MNTTWVANYIEAQQRALRSISVEKTVEALNLLAKAHQEERTIFVIGNGGSASNASHFATDLGKGASDKLGKRFRVLSLTDNVSWMTAIGNDYAYQDIFVRQIENFAKPQDILISVSVSGNSPNCVAAMQWAKEHQMHNLALVGAKRGEMAELADTLMVIGDTHYGRVEDCQMHVLHMLCYAFMD